MELSFDEIVRYYGFIDKEKVIVYAKEIFENNIENLLKKCRNFIFKF